MLGVGGIVSNWSPIVYQMNRPENIEQTKQVVFRNIYVYVHILIYTHICI